MEGAALAWRLHGAGTALFRFGVSPKTGTAKCGALQAEEAARRLAVLLAVGPSAINLPPLLWGGSIPAASTRFAMSGATLGAHADNFAVAVKNFVVSNALMTAAVVAALIIAVAVLAYQKSSLETQLAASKAKEKLHVAPFNNLNTGGNNPMWYLGSMDAGNGGPVHRDATKYNVGAYHPRWRASAMKAHLPRAAVAQGRREGLHGRKGGRARGRRGAGEDDDGHTTIVTPDSPCGIDEILVSDPASGAMYCKPAGVLPPDPTSVCRDEWDPAASAEAMALSTVGSYVHSSYGENRFMSAVDAAYDTEGAMSDAELQVLMHQGGTP